jgi:hypothetical protein
MAVERPLKREISLLLIGALISAISVFLADYFNDKRTENRFNIQKKLELNYQLSKDLGRRFFLTFELFRKRRDKDTTIQASLVEYRQSKEDWNLMLDSYESLLSYYYGEPIKSEFIRDIYNPLIRLGQMAEYNKVSSDFANEFYNKREGNIKFISKLYRLAKE